MGALRNTFITCAKYVAPPLYRKINEQEAKEAFQEHTSIPSNAKDLWGLMIKAFMEEAGYDVETDEPYKKLFGLGGGKAEFDEIMESDTDARQEFLTTHAKKAPGIGI